MGMVLGAVAVLGAVCFGDCTDCDLGGGDCDFGDGEVSNSNQMPPFRAWVAWRPEHGSIVCADLPKTREEAEEIACMLTGNYYDEPCNIGAHEIDRAALAESGWQIIEVEVRQVEGEK